MNLSSILMTARAGKEDTMKALKKIFAVIFGLGFTAFAATQVIYWFNLDNKLMFFIIYPLLHKRYDKIERDRKF